MRLLQLTSGETASVTATQIQRWGVGDDAFLAELKAQEAVTEGDKRLAHDMLWHASIKDKDKDKGHKDKGRNGCCMPDTGGLNGAGNAWRGAVEDMSYASLSSAAVQTGKQPLTLIGNPWEGVPWAGAATTRACVLCGLGTGAKKLAGRGRTGKTVSKT